MKYLSLFSGIEAASVAWQPLDWECVGVAEIDPFACEVLKQRLPNVPNLGDITKITTEQLNDLKKTHSNIDILIGGSPCQSFSVAGLRKGLNDPRGNLMLEYIRVVATVRPTYFIWENVPGVLTSNNGKDFGTLLQAMEELGYQLCWRTLDSKNFGVPQRRRRVFLVGSTRNEKHPFEILFESESLQGDNSESRETRQDNTPKTTASTEEHDRITLMNPAQPSNPPVETHYAPSLIARMGTGGNQVPLIVFPFKYTDACKQIKTLTAQDGRLQFTDHQSIDKLIVEKQYASTLCARDHKGISSDSFGHDSQHLVNTKTKVRRLTPIECERLQGFPDNWTQISWRGKKPNDCPVSHRYKCLGNSMTTNVIQWIGQRIAGVPTTIYQSKKKLKPTAYKAE